MTTNPNPSNDCPEPPRIGALLDGELPAADAAALERHVASCPKCTAEVAALRAVARFVRSAGDVKAPESVRSAAFEAIERAAAQRSLTRLSWWLSGAAAAVALACGVQLVTSSPATASAQASAWEVAAVSGRAAEITGDATETRLAAWMVDALEQPAGRR